MKKLLFKPNKKPILTERFVLAEAVVDPNITAKLIETLKTMQTALQAFFEKNLALLESDNADTIIIDPLVQHYTETMTATKKLATQIALTEDPAITGSKFKEYVQILRGYFASTNANFATTNAELDKILNDFLAMSQKDALTKHDVTVIKEQVALIQLLLTEIDDDNASLFATASGVFTSVLAIIYSAKTVADVLDNPTARPFEANVEKSIPNFIAAMTSLDQAVLDFSNAVGNNKKQFSALIEKSKEFRDNWLAYSKDNFDIRAAKKAENKATAGIIWSEKFKQAVDKDGFWKEYYTKVWGNNAAKIEGLGDAFKQECEKLGFTEKNNPFLIFIRKCIVEDGFNILRPAYNVIHNTVATYTLSKSDIAGTGSLKENNIIFCKDLYTKSPTDIFEYLKLQDEIRDNAQTLATLDILPTTTTLTGEALNIATKISGSNQITLVYSFFFVDLVNSPVGAGSIKDKKLNILEDARGWFAECIGFDKSTRTRIVDSAAAATIINKLTSPKEGELVVYALSALMVGQDNSKKIRDMIKLPTPLPDTVDILNRAAELRKQGFIDFPTAQSMVTDIIKRYGALKP